MVFHGNVMENGDSQNSYSYMCALKDICKNM